MAIICDNDMEIILKGNEEETIRKMLDNRFFALMKMPVKKNHVSPYSSSVFVAHFNNWIIRSFAIRIESTKTVYEDCEYYLTLHHERGTNDKKKEYFDKVLERRKDDCISITYPTVDDLMAFLNDKELVLITSFMHYGNFEAFKDKDFLEDILLLLKDSESEYVRVNDYFDVRLFLTCADDNTNQNNSFHTEDVRNFDFRQRTVGLFENISKKYFSNQENYSALYYSAEFETQEKDIQAAYFVTRFHSNLNWDADPVNFVIVRISAFILPGILPSDRVRKLPSDKKTMNYVNGKEYMIDSIHCNSDIFFDLTEFEDYLDNYFCYIQYD